MLQVSLVRNVCYSAVPMVCFIVEVNYNVSNYF